MGDVVEETQRLAPRVPTLVFAASRAHGMALYMRFDAAGCRASYLDGDTPHDRARNASERRKR